MQKINFCILRKIGNCQNYQYTWQNINEMIWHKSHKIDNTCQSCTFYGIFQCIYIYVDKSIDLTSFFNSSLMYTKTLCLIVHVHLYVYSIWCVCTIYFITIGFELRFLKVFISYLNFGYLICNYFVTIWYICYWLLNNCLGW